MDDYLQKRMYVYRKSYKYFYKIGITLCIVKLSFSTSGLAGIVITPLIALSLGAGIIEILDKSLKIAERREEYQLCYKFYCQLLHLYKVNKLSEADIYIREQEFIQNLQYFPREKYLKQVNLNGY